MYIKLLQVKTCKTWIKLWHNTQGTLMIMTVFYVGTCNNGQRQHDYTCCMFKYNPNWEYRLFGQ